MRRNRDNYDKSVLQVFEIIGTFFLDVFYNHLYAKAKENFSAGRIKSLTDAYRTNIISYVTGIRDSREHYMLVVNKLHEYYQQKTRFSALVLSSFENKILEQFIPPEYFSDLDGQQRDSIFSDIIVSSVRDFGNTILRKYIHLVIDERGQNESVIILRDVIIDVFIMQREEYYNKFAEGVTAARTGVPVKVVEKIKDALAEEIKRRCTAEAECERARGIITQLLTRVDAEETYKKQCSQLEQQLREQQQLHEQQLHEQQSVSIFTGMGDSERDKLLLELDDLKRRNAKLEQDVKSADKQAYRVRQEYAELLSDNTALRAENSRLKDSLRAQREGASTGASGDASVDAADTSVRSASGPGPDQPPEAASHQWLSGPNTDTAGDTDTAQLVTVGAVMDEDVPAIGDVLPPLQDNGWF